MVESSKLSYISSKKTDTPVTQRQQRLLIFLPTRISLFIALCDLAPCPIHARAWFICAWGESCDPRTRPEKSQAWYLFWFVRLTFAQGAHNHVTMFGTVLIHPHLMYTNERNGTTWPRIISWTEKCIFLIISNLVRSVESRVNGEKGVRFHFWMMTSNHEYVLKWKFGVLFLEWSSFSPVIPLWF